MSTNIEKIRNVAITGHNATGKTMIVESILKATDQIDKKGSIQKGNTFSDYDEQEKERKMSINLTTTSFNWNDYTINLFDAPGYNDFINDSKAGIYASDHVITTFDAILGVQIGTERAIEDAKNMDKNIAVFINKMDKENANFDEAYNELKNSLDKPRPIVVQLPIGEGEDLKGVVDLVNMQAYESDGEGEKKIDIPSEIEDEVNEYREKLMEAIAEEDEELMMKVLEGEKLNDEEMKKGLKKALQMRDISPVFFGSAEKQIGIFSMIKFITEYFDSPKEFSSYKLEDEEKAIEIKEDGPFIAKVYKTLIDPYTGKMSLIKVLSGKITGGETVRLNNEATNERIAHVYIPKGKELEEIDELSAGMIGAINKVDAIKTAETLTEKKDEKKVEFFKPQKPVYSQAIHAGSGNQDKLATGLNRLTEEDPYIKSWRNRDTKQSILSGLGNIHIEVLVSRLKERFNVDVETSTPKVSYKETLAKKVKSHHRHKKQSGGRGQYGEVYMEFKPLKRGEGFKFINNIVGGVIPSGFIPAVEKGVKNKMEEGVIAGYPVIDIEASLYDGSHHSVDSDEHSFKIAGSKAFSKAFDKAGGVLLEPISKVTIEVPKDQMGDVMGDLNSKRGKILGMDPLKKGWQEIRAEVPESEMQNYSIDLRSITSGMGRFETEFAYYQRAPEDVQKKVVEEYEKSKEEND